MPRAVILTALPVEYLAVQTHLIELQEDMHPQETIYERGKFIGNEQEWEVGIAEVGAGNAGAAVEAERAIAHFKPNILLFVGIAGGIKDVAIGDVVVATDVYGYESGKVGEQFLTRPQVGKSAYALVQRAKSEARKGKWLQRLSSNPVPQPRVFVAPIAAGEKVIASKQSDIFQFLRASYNDAIAIEMEGFGFLSAAFVNDNIKAIVIRGISDLIEGKNDDSVEPEAVRQEKASHHASAFAFEMLSKLEITPQDLRESHQETKSSAANPQQKQRLEQRQEALQTEWNLRSEKLQQLRQALVIESAVTVKFQLEKQIQDEEKQLSQLEDKLNSLEQALHNPLVNSLSKIKESFFSASKGLLNWKRTLGDKRQIPRRELEQLKNRIATESSSTTIVLGAPGCGKSALMATLGHWAVEEKYALLAIKADYLNNTVNTIEDLQHDIHLDRHPQDGIKTIANQEKIIVLIDQLDALSELLDRQPGRLNVLLSLILYLSDTENVHIVATCREFEFRHGTQFARLEHFERLDLQLPTWKDIAPILGKEQHNPNSMGEPLRELLQNPLHLKIFLEIAKPGEVFESFPRLLERLWEKRILKQSEAKKCINFLTQLAERMTEEEVLWLPSSRKDECPKICHALEQSGILMTNPDNSTIGFCHQTFYDYTLARAFDSGSQSLADFVMERQDGLFVRPILLRSLNYLRGTSSKQYRKQLEILLQTSQQQVKSHIRNLLIGFVGAQSNPNLVEAGLLIPLLNSETEGIKVLDAMTGSPGWFRRLRDCPEFTEWLEQPPEKAAYCYSFLMTAAHFASKDVWELLEEYWLNDASYDLLSIGVIRNISQWTPERIWLAEQILCRTNIGWHDVFAIAKRIADTLPNYAARVIRAHLDYLLAQAVEASKILPPELPSDANEVKLWVHVYQHDPLNHLKPLLENSSNFYEIEKFAEAHPQNFLASIWSWFKDLTQRLADDTESIMSRYRWEPVDDITFSNSEIIKSLLTAITKLAKQDKSAFFKFVEQNADSDLLVVHRLLAHGLEVVASEEATKVLNYLLADPRRLSLGSNTSSDCHRETKKLIAAIFPHLQLEDRERLEQTIWEFTYWQLKSEEDVNFRRTCLEYNREHRLSLLQAIPEEYLSPKVRRLKEEEKRALPWFDWRKSSNGSTIARDVGPRMTKDEMSRASDQHLLNLFNKLSDETGWDYPRRWYNERSRAGEAIQQPREFGELVKDNPSRFIRILPQLEPQRHESYVGDALENLAETDFSANALIQIIEDLEQRGFVSETFRSDAARALEKIAKRHQGLPPSILALLESWLSSHSKPELAYYRSDEDRCSNLKSPIFFGRRGFHSLPSGRGNIIRAIAEGYLEQNPPNLEGWTKFISSQLSVEPHPAVWVDMLSRMPPLLNGDRTQATELFDQIICNCPEVLQYARALDFISCKIGQFEPQETVQGWLEILKSNHSNFSQQAYGELLLIQYLQYQDEWSVKRIRHYLNTQDNEAILCGLAHAASHLWVKQRCRAIAAEILYTLASSSSKFVQHAVASIFRLSRDDFKLNRGMRKIIKAVCQNQDVLLEAANDLTEIIEVEELVDKNPEIVAEVCKSLLSIGIELTNPARATALIAESLTTIAIQLHRQRSYREVGLHIFEQLLALNLRETKSALEVLDRRPMRQGYYVAPRRRLRKRRLSSS